MQAVIRVGRDEDARRRFLLVMVAVAVVASGWVAAGPAAASERTQRDDIVIRSDGEFSPERGVRRGAGTAADPYVISGWDVRNVTLKDTDAYVTIRDNTIRGRLILDWNGPRVRVVDNVVNDLRVNQNVRRTGAPTSGLIARNEFGVVGQLRHFDGIFERNTVGQPGTTDLPFFTRAAVIFDGFNGARFQNNTIYGMMSVKLHGHHHGSGFGDGSHDHAHSADHGDHDGMDHTRRYHRVRITGNRITHAGEFALIFHDRAHTADDRTAASEQNEELNKPHKHHTRAYLIGNQLSGAGLLVDIFNADNGNHTGVGRGMLTVRNNTITTERSLRSQFERKDAILVRQAQSLDLRIVDNRTSGVLKDEAVTGLMANDAGIRLQDLDNARVHVYDNEVQTLEYGVFASRFTDSVHWWIGGLETSGVAQPVYYDDSVSNPPKERR